MTVQPPSPPPQNSLERFIGGSPLSVAVRLGILCVVVGLIMAVLGLSPRGVIEVIRASIGHIFYMGIDAFGSLFGYFLLGAGVVLPVWLIMRLVKAR